MVRVVFFGVWNVSAFFEVHAITMYIVKVTASQKVKKQLEVGDFENSTKILGRRFGITWNVSQNENKVFKEHCIVLTDYF